MGFIKIILILQIAVTRFGAGFEKCSACSKHFVFQTVFLVGRIIQKIPCRESPKVKQGELFATEVEVFAVKLFFFILLVTLISNFITELALYFFPLVIIGRIQFPNIQVSERNCFLKIKHRVISAHGVNLVEVGQKDFRNFIPRLNNSFTLFKHIQIKRTLFCIISGVKHGRDGESFSNQKLLTVQNLTLAVSNSPTNIINQRTSNSNFFLLFSITASDFIGKGQSSSFTIQNHMPIFLTSHFCSLPAWVSLRRFSFR